MEGAAKSPPQAGLGHAGRQLPELLAIPLTLSAVGLGVSRSFDRLAADEAAAARESAKAIGLPMTMSDVPMPVVPNSLNAAPIYRRAHVLLDGPLAKAWSTISPGIGKLAKPEDRAAAVGSLPRLQPLFDVLEGLKTKPLCDFHRDWSQGMLLPFSESADMKGCVKALSLRADVRDIRGDWKGALQDLALANRIAADCTSDPVMIGLMVRVAARAVVNLEYEVLIERHSHDGAFLSALNSQLSFQRDVLPLRRTLTGEIAFGFVCLHTLKDLDCTMKSGEIDDGCPEPTARLASSPFVEDSLETSTIRHWIPVWKMFPQDDADWRGFRLASEKLAQELDADRSIVNQINPIGQATFTQAMNAVGTLQAHDRLLLTSVALLRARLQTGKLPNYLPASLGENRIDPFDGNLLRYKRLSRSFILYSIGKDGVDDGGRRRSSDDPGSDVHNDEVVEFP